jgi:hypothetical protein
MGNKSFLSAALNKQPQGCRSQPKSAGKSFPKGGGVAHFASIFLGRSLICQILLGKIR